MPIIKNEDRVQLEFGHGDIKIAHGLVADMGAVLFFPSEPTPIGTHEEFETPIEVAADDTPIRFIFEKEESIDVLIRALLDAKRLMIHKRAEDIKRLGEDFKKSEE
jgi:hypothetical protein